jgi:diacylglycerol kinase (ATP)
MSPDRSLYKGTSGTQHVFSMLLYSAAGLKTAFRTEAAFRQIVLINLILIPLSFWISQSLAEQALMVAVCLLALIVELINSAIEAVVDRISIEQHELSKNAKDMGSAAQFVALSLITVTWGIILIGHSF